MAFRISDATIFDSSVRNIQRNRLALQQLQLRAGSGKRLNALSDDPSGTSQLLGLRRALGRIEQFERNINSARANLEASEAALAGVTGDLIKIRELAVSADGPDLGEFDQIQSQVEELFEDLLQLANTRSGSGFVFGGFRNASAPFTAAADFDPGLPSPAVTYNGDTGEIDVQIGETSTITTNLVGSDVFQSAVDVFDVVGDLRDALRTQDLTEVQNSLTRIDSAIEQVVNARGVVGARVNRLDVAEEQLQSLDVTLEKERSGIEDADTVRAITDLVNRENTLQASLAVTARVLQHDLVDFLS